MNRVSRPALRGSLLGAVLKVWNPVMKAILRSPFHWPLSRWFAVVSWTGRKTGRHYSTPVSYVLDGSTVWVTTGDRWWHNVRDGGMLGIQLRGRRLEGTATPITGRAESLHEHERLFRAHHWFRFLSGIPGDGHGGPSSDALERAIAAGRVLVRIALPAEEV